MVGMAALVTDAVDQDSVVAGVDLIDKKVGKSPEKNPTLYSCESRADMGVVVQFRHGVVDCENEIRSETPTLTSVIPCDLADLPARGLGVLDFH
jgi:hypothetical protein